MQLLRQIAREIRLIEQLPVLCQQLLAFGHDVAENPGTRDPQEIIESVANEVSMQMAEILTFTDVVRASGRSPEIPEASDAYGWLVGSWALDCRRYANQSVSIPGEAHSGWALEGRAIQDVWIMPSRSARNSGADRTKNMFGTTLRVWDSSIQAWRISWRNPVHNHWEDQIGRRSGKDVVQVGVRPNGTSTRWSFTEITKDSFHWLGEALDSDRQTWKLEGEFFAKRFGS